MKMFLTPVLSILLTSSISLADSIHKQFDSYQAKAVAEFLKQANSPDTELYKAIQAFSGDVADSRQTDGSVTMPLTEESLQVVTVRGESSALGYRGGAQIKNGYCVSSGDAALTVRIYVSADVFIRGGWSVETKGFEMTMNETSRFKTNLTEEEAYRCNDYVMGEETEKVTFEDILSFSKITELP